MFEETHNAPTQPVFSSLKILFRDDAVTVVVVVFSSSLFSFQRATKFSGHMIMATGSTRDVITNGFTEDRSRIC